MYYLSPSFFHSLLWWLWLLITGWFPGSHNSGMMVGFREVFRQFKGLAQHRVHHTSPYCHLIGRACAHFYSPDLLLLLFQSCLSLPLKYYPMISFQVNSISLSSFPSELGHYLHILFCVVDISWFLAIHYWALPFPSVIQTYLSNYSFHISLWGGGLATSYKINYISQGTPEKKNQQCVCLCEREKKRERESDLFKELVHTVCGLVSPKSNGVGRQAET